MHGSILTQNVIRTLGVVVCVAFMVGKSTSALGQAPKSLGKAPGATMPAWNSSHNEKKPFAKRLEPTLFVTKPDDWCRKIGLRTTFREIDGSHGEQIDYVELGSFANRMNLNRGDTIVAVNGIQLSEVGTWRHAAERASRLGGWLTLKIRDGSTGAIAYRTGNLRASSGP